MERLPTATYPIHDLVLLLLQQPSLIPATAAHTQIALGVGPQTRAKTNADKAAQNQQLDPTLPVSALPLRYYLGPGVQPVTGHRPWRLSELRALVGALLDVNADLEKAIDQLKAIVLCHEPIV